MEGVIRTRAGYTGGTKVDPTYHDLGDHTESLQIDFDPTVLEYEDLLEVFWESHNPWRNRPMQQYQLAVFTAGETQRQAVEEAVTRLEAGKDRRVQTRAEPLETFYRAEDYHQKYRLRRHRDLMTIFDQRGYTPRDFADSTAAARLNGYASGCGTPEQLAREAQGLGLSAEHVKRLQGEL